MCFEALSVRTAAYRAGSFSLKKRKTQINARGTLIFILALPFIIFGFLARCVRTQISVGRFYGYCLPCDNSKKLFLPTFKRAGHGVLHAGHVWLHVQKATSSGKPQRLADYRLFSLDLSKTQIKAN